MSYKVTKKDVFMSIGGILFFVACSATFYGSYQARNLPYQVAALSEKVNQLEKIKLTPGAKGDSGVGLPGLDGISIKGDKGDSVKGDPGEDAPGLTADQVFAAVQAIIGANPELFKGADGVQGKTGRAVFQRLSPITGEDECRYSIDESWQPISECL